jgi:virginiamycin A acetyltransferase
MNGANHSMAGFSTYPFYIFGGAWADMVPPDENQTSRGDTVVGSDVWIGYGATILPGIKIGHGAIIGACSVVTRDVEPYTIVGGNPAQPIRKRYDDATMARLLELDWWDWPVAKLTPHLPAFIRGDRDWLASADADQNSAT